MNRQQPKLDLCDVERATAISNEFSEAAERCSSGEDGLVRLEKSLCQYHFYWSNTRIGGAMTTRTNCRLCNVEMVFGNTCIDALCLACAKANALCCRCGATLDGRSRRKQPKPAKGMEVSDD